MKQDRHCLVDRIDPRNVSCENEKEEKGAQKTVIHHQQGIPIGEKENEGDEDQPYAKWNQAEYDENGYEKQNSV